MRSKLLAIAAFTVFGIARAEAALPLPDGAVVLPATLRAQLLGQCSRGAPSPGEAGWQPGAADIAALEAALPAALAADPHHSAYFSRAPVGWRRQYVGIVRHGQRFIYGNFFMRGLGGGTWEREPVIVCDGGTSFFGVDYDAEAGRIVGLAFNGVG
jgi:hypothetical protein